MADLSDELGIAKPKTKAQSLAEELGLTPATRQFTQAEKNAVEAPMDWGGVFSQAGQNIKDMALGGLRGAGSIGTTLLRPYDALKDAITGDANPTLSSLVTSQKPLTSHEKRVAEMEQSLKDLGAQTDSGFYKGGKLYGEVAGTAGMGGALGNAARLLPSAVTASRLAAPAISAIESSGMSAGGASGLTGSALRVLGGGITGGASAGLVDPSSAGEGAAIGALLPPALQLSYAGGKNILSGLRAAVQPFTEAGQNSIRDQILRRAVGDSPIALNTAELVPGSTPTLAEATGNANIAGLQRVARHIRPQAFVQQEQANAAARNALFENASGDAGKLDFFKGSRKQAATQLYDDAFKSGFDQSAIQDPSVQKSIKEIMSRPAMVSATEEAQRMAKNAGIDINNTGSVQGMHYTKLALDDQIGKAISSGNSSDAFILQGLKDKLTNVIEQISPKYAEANATFEAMSKPVNQMEFLQGLKLTDAQGNITLSKVQNAIRNIEFAKGKAGFNGAKSLDDAQVGALTSIRDDLLRQANTNLGKSAGSNTFQNISTNNILANAMPGKIGQMVSNRISTPLAQVGQLIYNKPNQAIQEKLIESMLNPQSAQAAFAPLPPAVQNQQLMGLLGNMYKTNPSLLTGLLNQGNQ